MSVVSLGMWKREEMPTVHGDFVMEHGDLFVLEPTTNGSCAHGVPYDQSADGLRVSLVLRHVSKHEVRVLAEPPAEDEPAAHVVQLLAPAVLYLESAPHAEHVRLPLGSKCPAVHWKGGSTSRRTARLR